MCLFGMCPGTNTQWWKQIYYLKVEKREKKQTKWEENTI